MALTRSIEEARRQTATRANREAQNRAELRLTEIVKTAGIADEYETVDRDGDLKIEGEFATLYQSVDSEAERQAVVRAFVIWQKCEQAEDGAVRQSVGSTVQVLKTNNPVWLNGAAVPVGSDGVA